MFRAVFSTAAALLMMTSLGKAETTREVFVLSIGSGDYAETESSDVYAFADNDAAYLGAQRVAKIFRYGGARHVLQLLGRDGEYLSIFDVYTAIDDIATKALNSGAADPILVIYFSGHGISENFGYNLFLVPGDLIIPHRALDLDETITTAIRTVIDIEGVGVRAPTTLNLKERLDKTGIPYLLVIDTCFETDASLDIELVRRFSEELAELMSNTSDIVRFLSLPRGPHPIVFSAQPGAWALPEEDPTNKNNFIAPLARRLVLAAEAAKVRGETLDSAKVVRALTHDDEGFGGKPGVTWFEGSFEAGSILAPGAKSSASIDRRRGTSRAAQLCCQ